MLSQNFYSFEAVVNGHFHVVKKLIQAKANLDLKDNDGYTALNLGKN